MLCNDGRVAPPSLCRSDLPSSASSFAAPPSHRAHPIVGRPMSPKILVARAYVVSDKGKNGALDRRPRVVVRGHNKCQKLICCDHLLWCTHHLSAPASIILAARLQLVVLHTSEPICARQQCGLLCFSCEDETTNPSSRTSSSSSSSLAFHGDHDAHDRRPAASHIRPRRHNHHTT